MDVKSRSILGLLFMSLVVVFLSCNGGKTTDPDLDPDLDELDDTVELSDSQMIQVQQIFVNVPSPIEMATILQRSGSAYNHDVLNSVENVEQYTTIEAAALNLGTYGADLSYTRMFDQIQESVNYLAVIRRLSDRLGIPQDEGSFTVAKLEENIDDKDTLLSIISDTYSSADTYLKESDRGSTAALIIFGGWAEALYIATHILDQENPDKEIMDRIAEQKYSLDNLMQLVDIYSNEGGMIKFRPFLERLAVVFNKIEFIQTKGEIVTDTVNKTTTIGGKQEIKVTIENINEITVIVEELRNQIIS